MPTDALDTASWKKEILHWTLGISQEKWRLRVQGTRTNARVTIKTKVVVSDRGWRSLRLQYRDFLYYRCIMFKETILTPSEFRLVLLISIIIH